MNMVERWFSALTTKELQGSTYRSVKNSWLTSSRLELKPENALLTTRTAPRDDRK